MNARAVWRKRVFLILLGMLGGAPATALAACDAASLEGPWGFLSSNESPKKHGQYGFQSILMRARLRADGTLSGTIFRNRMGYVERAWQNTAGVFGIGPTCNLNLFWRDPVGSRYTVKGFVSEDGKTFFGAGQAEGFAFSLLGRKI
jgi:hypothetical protein